MKSSIIKSCRRMNAKTRKVTGKLVNQWLHSCMIGRGETSSHSYMELNGRKKYLIFCSNLNDIIIKRSNCRQTLEPAGAGAGAEPAAVMKKVSSEPSVESLALNVIVLSREERMNRSNEVSNEVREEAIEN